MLRYQLCDLLEGLARFRILDVASSYRPDICDKVPFLFGRGKNGLVDLTALLVQFAGKDTRPTNRLERMVKPTDAGKEIDELERLHALNLRDRRG